jgi:Cdc6-like AAA superfamily ATPase
MINHGLNPFPAAGVARLSPPEAEFWSIETQALKQARGYLQQYLRLTMAKPGTSKIVDRPGFIMAIVGDYGTGKTHIAQEMLRQLAVEKKFNIHELYLDAPSDTFLALYRERFLAKLDRRMVLSLVDEYYADIVAQELSISDLTKPAADALIRREISADQVVREFGLIETTFVRALNAKLKDVTEHSDFGTALSLLRRPQFQAAVWEWLSGTPPDPILRERGIERHINDDAAALEAIGVMAFLFGYQEHRFILFIDEVEKVLSHSALKLPSSATMLALKKLMESLTKTSAMLVLIGLPEFQDFLPDDARQRITVTIRPSEITTADIAEYVREANRRAGKDDTLQPFTTDAIDYLSDISGGNARRVVRLCYHAYHEASEADTNVTRSMLRQIARDQFESTRPEDVATETTQLLDARGLIHERGKIIKAKKEQRRVDFWLPVGTEGSGIAIWITRSILQPTDVKEVTQALAVLRESNPSSKAETVLIVNGYLAENLRSAVDGAFRKVLIYRARSFREDLDSVITGLRLTLEEGDRQNMVALIKQRIDEISRQHISINRALTVLSDRSLQHSELQSAVSSALRLFFGQLAAGGRTTADESGYPRITVVFDEALRTLDELLEGFDTSFNLFFGVGDNLRDLKDGPFGRHSSGRNTVDRLLDDKYVSGLATISIARSGFFAFRKGVFSALSRRSRVRADDETLDAIRGQCINFDYLAERIDFSSALKYAAVLNDRISSEFGPDSELRGRAGDASRDVGELANRAMRELARRVFQAVRHELPEGSS